MEKIVTLTSLIPELKRFTDWKTKRFWVLVVLMVYTLGGFLGVPALIKYISTNQIQEKGHSLSLEKVEFNPYYFTLRITQADLKDTDQSTVLTFDEFFINFQLSSLFRWAWTFKEIRLTKPVIHEHRFAEGGSRLSRFGESFLSATETNTSQEDGPKAEHKTNTLVRLLLSNAALVNGQLHFIDETTPSPYQTKIGPINFQLNNFSTLPERISEQQLTIQIDEHGLLSWQGKMQVQPLSGEGTVTLTGKDFPDLRRYADLILPFKTQLGSANFSLNYQLSSNEDLPALINATQITTDIQGLSLHQTNPEKTPIHVSRIQLADGALLWPTNTLQADSLAISGLQVDAIRNKQGDINLLGLIPKTNTPKTNASKTNASKTKEKTEVDQPKKSSQPWQLGLNSFSINNSTINLADQTLQTPAQLALHDISLTLNNISNQNKQVMPAKLSMVLGEGGRVSFAGNVSAIPNVTVDGNVHAEAISLQVVQPYVSETINVRIDDGKLFSQGQLVHQPEELMAYSGNFSITDLDIKDGNKNEALVGWQQLAMDTVKLSLQHQVLETSKININEAYGRVFIAKDKSTNISDLLVEKPETKNTELPLTEEEKAADSFAMTIEGVGISNASVDFTDLSLPLPFAADIRSLNGEVSAIATHTTEPAQLALEGQVNEFGLARINGNVAITDPQKYTDITMIFRNLEMYRLSPYSGKFAGYTIKEGKLDLDLGYKITDQQLDGDNKIVMNQLVLGDKIEHPEAGSLPLKLAVALLKDSDGIIDLNLPVSGDLNNPEFAIGDIVAKALGNILTKIITSPFRFLASLVGSESEDFGQLEFAPGRFDLSPPDQEKLLKLSQAMSQRPTLTLEVHGVYAKELDGEALQKAQVDNQIDEKIQEQKAAGLETSTQQAIEALYIETYPDLSTEKTLQSITENFTHVSEKGNTKRKVFDKIAYTNYLKQQLIAAKTISENDLQILAKQRATAVVKALGENSNIVQLDEIVSIEPETAQSIPLELKIGKSQ